MSDIKILEDKIDIVMVDIQKVENKLDDVSKQFDFRLDEVDERVDNHAENIRSLLQWRDSNGSPGAEDRLRTVEKCSIEIEKEKLPARMYSAEADIISLHRIADSTMRSAVHDSVTETLDKRSKTTIEKVKAWGPIVSAGLAAAAIVLSAVL